MRRPSLRHRRASTTVLALTLLATACTSGDDPLAAVSDEVPADWHSEVVDDDREGDFVLSWPQDAALWQMGDETTAVDDATGDTAWGDFWIPLLDDATSDRDNVRAVAVIRDDEAVTSWQINVAPVDTLPEEPAELATAWAQRFEDQDLDVEVTTTTEWNQRTIALVEFRVPEGVFDGEQRYIRQWFVPDEQHQRLWSFVCDAPEDAELSQETCRTALDGFRPSDAPAGTDV